MKIPASFFDANGKPAKGEMILVKDDEDQTTLPEFGQTRNGIVTSCYVLTSPGDVLRLRFALNAHIADQADLVVDGILRSSIQNKSAKGFKGVFKKALYKEQKPNGKRAGLKSCSMKVKERGTSKDTQLSGVGGPSDVGSISIRLFRKDHSSNEESSGSSDDNGTSAATTPAPDTNKPAVKRAPTFEEYAEWSDCKSSLASGKTPLPPFVIDFVDGTQAKDRTKEQVLKEMTGYDLWAIFVFHLRSAADIGNPGHECEAGYIAQAAASSSVHSRTTMESAAVGVKPTSSTAPAATEDNLPNGLVEEEIKNEQESTKAERKGLSNKYSSPDAQKATLSGVMSVLPGPSKKHSLESAKEAFLEPMISKSTVDGLFSKDRSIGPRTSMLVVGKETGKKFDVSRGGSFAREGTVSRFSKAGSTPTTAASASNDAEIPVDDVLPKGEPLNSFGKPGSRQRNTLVGIPGVKGAPAHQAFLERAPTEEEEESRSQLTVAKSPKFGTQDYVNGISELFSQQAASDVRLLEDVRQTSLPPEPVPSMEGGRYRPSGNHNEFSNYVWKLLTPPNISLKNKFSQSQRGSVDLRGIWRRSKPISRDLASNSISSPKVSKAPAKFQSGIIVDGTRGAQKSQASSPTASTQSQEFGVSDPRAPLPSTQPQATNAPRQSPNPSPPEPLGKSLLEEPSDTETEVAHPEDIERAIRSSRRTDIATAFVASPQSFNPDPSQDAIFKSEPAEPERAIPSHPSPILEKPLLFGPNPPRPLPRSPVPRMVSTSRMASGIPTGDPAEEVLQLSKGKPSHASSSHRGRHDEVRPVSRATPQSSPLAAPQPSTEPVSPPVGQAVGAATGTGRCSPHVQGVNQTITKTTVPEKRKAEVMTGNNALDSSLPNKRSMALAQARSGGLEADRQAAEARMSAAEKENRRLRKELGEARLLEARLNEIRQMNNRAAAVEKENAEMRARSIFLISGYHS
ncbi:uncharacterized protein L3040_007857 [Drepanopeziza brunnea f. sp. 'multigermtubi']|uniref:Uncharacterized protein n=1 Tax=Marssonina brunnea f. sp. multigermtubi (strain MB_m1) TaxID=1072389 RepID=K1WZW7_MARBU|nr:uncharacterized protein MBM_07820 [Drepanopeziza brunnea f. sp. 'multigermtubi' MB_m1]EKD14143.1 hypothetical protein MBM_07820 [Drepanopeziza brunnea f. sp. 'multigermtubi' MB_m1]KAJ5035387.1 hypothetical protein L3040_007857 [Drepanopeziza brunnea f. sp. 'multigermtubi']